MTEEEARNYEAYAATVYRRDPGAWYCRNESMEDFIQSFLLCALEHEGADSAYILHALKLSRKCPPECIPYKVESMAHFSDLISDGKENDVEYIEKLAGLAVEDDYDTVECGGADYAAWYLYRTNPKGYELFLDYMHGMSCGGSKNRDIRERAFNNRYDLLKILYATGFLCPRDYKRYKAIADGMTEPAKAVKMLSMSSTAVNCRKYYEKNKEKFAAKAKAWNARQKAGKQPPNA